MNTQERFFPCRTDDFCACTIALAKFVGIQIRVCHENHEHLNRAKFVDCTEVYLQMIKHDDFTVSINLTD